jgi:NHL repeat
MTTPTRRRVLLVATALLTILATATAHAEAPVKLPLASHIGLKVDQTTGGNVCTIASKDVCVEPPFENGEPVETGLPGAFYYPRGVAVAPAGNVYVADTNNNRVQELDAAGNFVLMFGKDVNETTGGNVCTAASNDTCKAGESGEAPATFNGPTAVAVDPGSEDIYVADTFNQRVQELTPAGEFVLMIGKGVNETTGGNVCTAASNDTCKAGTESSAGEPGAFLYPGVVAVGPEHTLYVGDFQRVQKFDSAGTFEGEFGVSAHTIGVDQATGNLYVQENTDSQSVIRELKPGGEEIASLTVAPREPGAQTFVTALAAPDAGRLAVAVLEYRPRTNSESSFGRLYDAQTLAKVGGFPIAGRPVVAMAFASSGELYALTGLEILAYGQPLPVGLVTTAATNCEPGPDNGSSATFSCTFHGEANPEGVAETNAWFQWGRTFGFGSNTAVQPIVETVPLNPVVTGLGPNTSFDDRLVGEDHNSKAPELLEGESTTFTTPAVAPRLVGEPSIAAVSNATAVLFAELNPENSETSYRFQYGACEDLEHCPGRVETPVEHSSAYGTTGTTAEIAALQPATAYHYRLLIDGQGGEITGATATFTTARGSVVQASTGPAGEVTASSAVLTGTVDPDGLPATYTFELGVYAGAQTQFSIVSSGSAGAGSSPAQESVPITGLQPGTVYAYRIAAHNGDGSTPGDAATGATATFTTTGVPSVLSSPSVEGLLAIPAIFFPKEEKGSGTSVKTLTNKQKLAKALTACHKLKGKQRAICIKSAHKRYVVNTNAKGKKHAGGKRHG